MPDELTMPDEEGIDTEFSWGKGYDCLVCDGRATHSMPVIDRPWVDKLPIIRWLRKMYNAPPRHTVVMRGKRALCSMHFGLAEQMADDEVAERRHTQALLNGREFMKVHQFNRGLIKLLESIE